MGKEYNLSKSKVAALIISGMYLVAGFLRGSEVFFLTLILLVLPLASIFFSEEMGNYTGWAGLRNPKINQTSPGCLIAFLGWALLLMPGIILLIGINK